MLKAHYKSSEFSGEWIENLQKMDNLDILTNLGDISTFMLKQDSLIQVCLNGPEETPYTNFKILLLLNIPDNYPKSPPICFFSQTVYHLNVDQETSVNTSSFIGEGSQILLNSLTKANWKQNTSIFEIVVQVL